MAKLPKEERVALEAFLHALDVFAQVDKDMPVQQIRTFVFVTLHEGEGTMELSRRSGINNTVMSRYLAALSDFNRYKEAGLDLVYQEMDVQDKRTRKAYLTEKGVTKRHELIRALRA